MDAVQSTPPPRLFGRALAPPSCQAPCLSVPCALPLRCHWRAPASRECPSRRQSTRRGMWQIRIDTLQAWASERPAVPRRAWAAVSVELHTTGVPIVIPRPLAPAPLSGHTQRGEVCTGVKGLGRSFAIARRRELVPHPREVLIPPQRAHDRTASIRETRVAVQALGVQLSRGQCTGREAGERGGLT